MDERPQQAARPGRGRQVGRAEHFPVQFVEADHLSAHTLLPVGQEGHEPRHVRGDAPAGGMPDEPESGRLLSGVSDDRVGHRDEERLHQEVRRTNQYRAG